MKIPPESTNIIQISIIDPLWDLKIPPEPRFWNQTSLEERKEKKEIAPEELLSEEMIRWMTEGTNPNMIPRSDNG